MVLDLLVAVQASGLLAPRCHVFLSYLKPVDGVDNVYEAIPADASVAPTLVTARLSPHLPACCLVRSTCSRRKD